MKTKLMTLIVALLALAFAPILSAQSLIPKSDAQVIAERIDQQQAELLNHVESQLRSFHTAVNTEGKQQAILDALGTNAAAAVSRYVAMRELVLQLNPKANVPAPDPKIFVLNPQGTVTYVAPPKKEIAEPTKPE